MTSTTAPDLAAYVTYVQEILDHQRKLNSMYDPNWRVTYEDQRLMYSCVDEFNELVSEISLFTRFYDSKQKTRFDLALEEFIDITHFVATRCLLSGHVNVDVDAINLSFDLVDDGLTPVFDVTIHLNRILNSAASNHPTYCTLALLLKEGTKLFDVSVDTLMVAYLHKWGKNKERAICMRDGGDLVALKASEEKTYAHLYSKSLVSLSVGEFNEKLTTKYMKG